MKKLLKVCKGKKHKVSMVLGSKRPMYILHTHTSKLLLHFTGLGGKRIDQRREKARGK